MLATTGHTIVTQNVGRLIVCTLMFAKGGKLVVKHYHKECHEAILNGEGV